MLFWAASSGKGSFVAQSQDYNSTYIYRMCANCFAGCIFHELVSIFLILF